MCGYMAEKIYRIWTDEDLRRELMKRGITG